MRDAFGGAFMIKLLIVFIVIYVGFTALALNYAKAFKVKNKVIEYLEDNEVYDINRMPAADFNKMNDYFEKEIIGDMNYKSTISCIKPYAYCDNGILIVQHDDSGKNKAGAYFTVSTTFGWEIPFLNVLLKLNEEDGEVGMGQWVISGETRTIVNET